MLSLSLPDQPTLSLDLDDSSKELSLMGFTEKEDKAYFVPNNGAALNFTESHRTVSVRNTHVDFDKSLQFIFSVNHITHKGDLCRF
jgi:hypothetical protein